MAVKFDIKQGSTITRDKNGWRIERIGLVTFDLDTSPPAVDAILHAAATDGSLPALGDPHPSISTVYLHTITAEPVSAGKFRVRLIYTDDPGYPSTDNIAIRVSAATAPDTTGKDRDNLDLTTIYRTQNDIDNSWFSVEYFQANIERPRATIEFTYTVTGTFPKSLIDGYLGTINATTWNGYPLETVMCQAVDVSPQGDDWRVVFRFVYNPDGWAYEAQIAAPVAQVVEFTDVGLNSTTGRKEFDIYPIAEFNTLGLNLVPPPAP